MEKKILLAKKGRGPSPRIKTPYLLVELTRAEFNVFREIVIHDLKVREVAEKFNVVEKTIKFHLSNIFKKHKVRRQVELKALYYEQEKKILKTPQQGDTK